MPQSGDVARCGEGRGGLGRDVQCVGIGRRRPRAFGRGGDVGAGDGAVPAGVDGVVVLIVGVAAQGGPGADDLVCGGVSHARHLEHHVGVVRKGDCDGVDRAGEAGKNDGIAATTKLTAARNISVTV